MENKTIVFIDCKMICTNCKFENGPDEIWLSGKGVDCLQCGYSYTFDEPDKHFINDNPY